MQVNSILEQLFFTTVKIDTRDQNGKVTGHGTGFIFGHTVNGKNYPFIVTNKHVVSDAAGGAITFHRGKDKKISLGDGYCLNFEKWRDNWTGHPDPDVDIIVCPFEPYRKYAQQNGVELFYRSVSTEIIPSPEEIENLDAIEPVTFIGYPDGIWDKKNLLPIARRGTTASPIEVDFNGAPQFIIDASVFGGSSGSPVFVYHEGSFGVKTGNVQFGARLFFVGVIASVFYKTEVNEIIECPIPTQLTISVSRNREMIDLGVVFKARTVVETIEENLRKFNLL